MKRYRSLFPVLKKFTFLNHAATAPVSLRVSKAVEDLCKSFTEYGGLHYSRWMNRVKEVRELAARLINSKPGEIAFTGNTSEGLSIVASGINWQPGDVVLVSYPDFPANIYPWLNLKRLGVKVIYIKRKENGVFKVDDIEKLITNRVRLISVSSVDFSTGFLCDLASLGKLCKEEGILLCVDAIQSLGVIPMDVKEWGIDFLAAGAHKWLQSIPGTGLLYVSEKIVERLAHSKVGWKTVEDEEDFSIHFVPKQNSEKFEPGTMNIAGIYALGAALELVFDIGIENIRNRIFSLNDLLFRELTKRNLTVVSPMEAGSRSGILSFSASGNNERLYRYLVENNIIVSLRSERIRVSPHFYNTEEDLGNLLFVIDKYTSGTELQ